MYSYEALEGYMNIYTWNLLNHYIMMIAQINVKNAYVIKWQVNVWIKKLLMMLLNKNMIM